MKIAMIHFIVNALFEPMKDMSFGIGGDERKGIITSDKTVYASAECFPCDEYDEIKYWITMRKIYKESNIKYVM